MTRLVLNPQRSTLSVTTLLISTLLLGTSAFIVATRPFHALMLFGLLPLFFVPLFTFLVFRTVELELRPGELMLTWIGWPYRRRTRILKRDDLRDIVVEEDEGGYRVVFILVNERVPLTNSYVGNDLTPLAERLKKLAGVE